MQSAIKPSYQDSYLLEVDEIALISKKKGSKNQFIFAFFLKFFQNNGRFPNDDDALLELPLQQLTNQLDCDHFDPRILFSADDFIPLQTLKRFRSEIRHHFGFREPSAADRHNLNCWLIRFIFPNGFTWEQMLEQAYTYFREQKIEPFAYKQLERFLHSAHRQFEVNFFKTVEQLLSSDTKKAFDNLLADEDNTDPNDLIKFVELKKETTELKIDAILYEIKKYQTLQSLKLPKSLESLGSRKLLQKYYNRVQVELPSHLKAHDPSIRYAYMTIFCNIRSQIMIDTLVDLLLQLTHRIQKKAEKQVEKYILSEVKRVNGKFDTLFLLAHTSVEKPLGIIQDEIYATVPKEKLKDIVDDLQHRGKWYQNQVRAKALSLYSHTNRRLVWALLETLSLQTDHAQCHEILQALQWIQTKNNNYITKPDKKKQIFTEVPFQQALNPSWLPFIQIKQHPDDCEFHLNEYAFELAIFEHLAKELRCKNIWVEGAYRYRNPLDDFPKNFDDNKQYYFHLLDLPEDANNFIELLQSKLEENIKALNDSIVNNPKVVISARPNKGAIKISPSLPQEEPVNLNLLQQEITHRWGSISLMDILKEADFRIGFTNRFQSVSSREVLNKDILRKRLLLCLYGIGTNTGLKRVSAGQPQDTYSDLRYVKRRYINCQNARAAIQDIVNAVLTIRDPKIWGVQTTGCACDSKKISVWDQNLMAEWHTRYRGRGVMIYWHVDKKAACIYSHLKTCSSSEVGAMMKGFLNHDTKMEMNQIYVDTHGQSTIGFAFSNLLHFDLLPRLKNINKQKLYVSSKDHKNLYSNLIPAFAKDYINLDKIKENYYEIVKYVAALKTGAVEAEVIMKRLSADNETHPIYQALLEIGKVARTIFLCRYLASEELRIEIHEALNVVERVNSIMGFIFYGRLGEISTNSREDQELAILGLHLLQVCMVYINTLMIQEIIVSPDRKYQLTFEDKRALSPLLHSHITPYGFFILDMNYRIPLKAFTANNRNY